VYGGRGIATAVLPGLVEAEKLKDWLHRNDHATADPDHRDRKLAALDRAIGLVPAEPSEDRAGGGNVGLHTERLDGLARPHLRRHDTSR
jgi:hypothetical protein